jgi:hypothetical protein
MTPQEISDKKNNLEIEPKFFLTFSFLDVNMEVCCGDHLPR